MIREPELGDGSDQYLFSMGKTMELGFLLGAWGKVGRVWLLSLLTCPQEPAAPPCS